MRTFLIFYLAHAVTRALSPNGVLCDKGECNAKIPEYPIMELLHQPYLVDRNQPFLIKGSGSIVWPLSDFTALDQNLDFIFSSYGNVSFEVQSSDCSCFGGDVDRCRREVEGLTYYSSAKGRHFGARRDSLWFQYETNGETSPCVHSSKQYAPVSQVMQRIRKYNEQNAEHRQNQGTNHSQDYKQMSFSFKIIEQNAQTGQLYVGKLHIPCFILSLRAECSWCTICYWMDCR